jgi:DNA polymerase
LVGEGPGRDEDQQGSAFVGRSGQLLDKVLTELGHDSVFITNCVRCRPPGNRNPEWYERAACFPYLEAELAEATGTVVALGKVAHHNLLERKIEHEHVWHPAFVLRDIKRYDEWKTQFPPA